IDDKGRVLYGYSDGCVTPGCIAGTAANDFVAFMRVARQSGGKSLFASNDSATDTTAARIPRPPCLSGTRDPSASHLTWKAPDDVCALPALTKLNDPAGHTSPILGIFPSPAPPGSDLLSFQIAQPYAGDNVIRLAFTINTDNGESPQPPGSSWYVAMKIVKNG